MSSYKDKSIYKKLALRSVIIASGALFLAACDDDDYTAPPVVVVPPTPKVFEVEVTNITHNQPFSPAAIVLHQTGSMWTLNQPASDALEQMAESGDNSQLLSESYVTASSSGTGIIGPGASESIDVETTEEGDLMLSVGTMLVNTNDAFTGLNSINVTNLAVGDSLSYRSAAYDAGTEGNTESAGTIPGPADGGEGFNSVRDDLDRVYRHPGVVTVNDGLTSSVLDQSHRFDNPVVSITIRRTQ